MPLPCPCICEPGVGAWLPLRGGEAGPGRGGLGTPPVPPTTTRGPALPWPPACRPAASRTPWWPRPCGVNVACHLPRCSLGREPFPVSVRGRVSSSSSWLLLAKREECRWCDGGGGLSLRLTAHSKHEFPVKGRVRAQRTWPRGAGPFALTHVPFVPVPRPVCTRGPFFTSSFSIDESTFYRSFRF